MSLHVFYFLSSVGVWNCDVGDLLSGPVPLPGSGQRRDDRVPDFRSTHGQTWLVPGGIVRFASTREFLASQHCMCVYQDITRF